MALRPDWRLAAGLLVLAVVLAGTLAVSPDRAIALAERVADNPVAFGAVLVGLYFIRPLFAWPTTALSVVVGAGYGVTVGIPVALVGVALTTIPTYLATRHLGVGERFPRVDSVGRRYFERVGPLRGTVAGRLVPLPADIVTCGAAVAGVRLRTLLAGTVVGEVPWTVAAVVVGSSAERIARVGLDGLGPRLAVATTVAGLALLAGPAYAVLSDGAVQAAAVGADDDR
jgi:uncharacterized membrane protein YdjX (TVP38/TMEM64 family)